MSARSDAPAGAPRVAGPRSLRGLLRRTHMLVAWGAVALVGLALAVPALTAVHFYAGHDLRLLGRAISYTVEAAVVFEDAESAQEELNAVLASEDVAQATVTARSGRVLARWRDSTPGWHAALGAATARLMLLAPVTVPVVHEGATVGEITVRGGGRTLLLFLALGVGGIVLCQALIVAGALYLSRRLLGRIMGPLQALAEVTGKVQRERAFGRRVPASGIAELDDLGRSFNALLAELDSWQTFMEGEHERLSYEATHDGLTGLPNRAYFEGRLSRALVEAKQAGTGLAILLIDGDRFKEINDTYGHAAGDAVLTAIASRLKGQVREHDVVARLGGDEFAVLISPAPKEAGLRGLLESLARSMDAPIVLRDGRSLVTSLSVGLATFPADGATTSALLHEADEAMYRAKRAARDE